MSRKESAVFIDVTNLFYGCLKKFGAKLDYRKLRTSLEINHEIIRAIAYGREIVDHDTEAFKNFLTNLGFQCHWLHDYNVNVKLTCDVARILSRVDCIIIGSNDLNLLPCLEFVKEEGCEIQVHAFNIRSKTRNSCDKWVEIDENFILKDEDMVVRNYKGVHTV